MPWDKNKQQPVTLLRLLVDQIKPEVRAIPDVQTRIINLLWQSSLTLRCCAEILAYYTFPNRDKSFDVLKAALISGGLKDSEVKQLISKLPDDKRYLFEPLLGVRPFNFFEISQMNIIPFQIFFQTLKHHSGWSLPLDLVRLYHRVPEDERTSENQQKLWDVIAHVLLYKLVKFSENEDDQKNEVRSLLHLLQHIPEWKLRQ